MNPEGVTHAPFCLAKTLLLSAARVMTLGRKIGVSVAETWSTSQKKHQPRDFPSIRSLKILSPERTDKTDSRATIRRAPTICV